MEEKQIEKYKFFIEKLREDFNTKYPNLTVGGQIYNQYVFNFIESAIRSALENLTPNHIDK